MAVLYSTGRDSSVMLDLFATYAPKSIGRVIFLYFCPNLSFEERILTYQERRYGIKIERRPHPDTYYMINRRVKKKKVRISDFEKLLRDEGSDWIAYGHRKDESLQRRGQLTMAPNGIDWKYRKLFPLSEWSEKHCVAWVKQRRIILPPEYKNGFRDLNSYKGDSLLYIHRNYPDDYRRIAEMYPDVEGELMHALNGT